ncbi:peptidyl-prolyl cis-trans isomerase [Candidatus Sumerlaeota bacterium]|nr:peptidyl-prolyl cis-trans isomerase [Candidatus Sumerlaeota bacterium]
MRNPKFVRRVMIWVLLLVIPSFVAFYGISSLAGGPGGGVAPYIAKVKLNRGDLFSEEIPLRNYEIARGEVENWLGNSLGSRRMSESELKKYARYIGPQTHARQAINDFYVRKQYAEQGITGTVEQLRVYNQEMFNAIQQQQRDMYERQQAMIAMGQPIPQNQLLRSPEFTKDDFRNVISRQYQRQGGWRGYEYDMIYNVLPRKLYDQLAESNVRASRTDFWRQYVKSTQGLKLEYVNFIGDDFADQVQVTTDSLKQYYEEHQEDYRVGEQARYEYVCVTQDALKSSIEISDDEIQKVYDQGKQPGGKYWQNGEVSASHIMLTLPEDDTDTASMEQVKARIDEIYEKVTSSTFAQLANEYSEDPMNSLDEKKMDGVIFRPISAKSQPFGDAFNKAAMALKTGEWSKPVQSKKGWHIILSRRTTPDGPKPLDNGMREDIRFTLKEERVGTIFKDKQYELAHNWDLVSNLEALAKEMNLKVITTDWGMLAPRHLSDAAEPMDFNPMTSINLTNEHRKELAELNAGVTTSKPLIGDKFAAIVRLKELREPFIPPFADIQEDVEQEYRTQLAAELASKAAEEFLAAVTQDSDQFSSKAAEMEYEVEQITDELPRDELASAIYGIEGFADDSYDATTGTVGLNPITRMDDPAGACVWRVSGVGSVDRDLFENQFSLMALNYAFNLSPVLNREHLADERAKMKIELNEEYLGLREE